MDIRKQRLEGFQNESASRIPQVMPAANEMNDYEDIIAVVTDDNDNSQQEQARKKSKTLATTSGEEDSLSYLFQLDQPVSLEEILGQDQTLPSQPHLGGSSSHYVAPQTVITNTRSTIQLNPNLSERINISVSTGIIVPNPSNNMGLLNSIFSSENCSTSFGDSIFPKTTGYSFTQFESPNFLVQPYASFGTGASASGLVGNYETQLQSPSLVHPYAAPSVGSGVAANNLDGNSLTQFQSPRLVHPYASHSVGSGSGANNIDGNSLNKFQSPSLVPPYSGPSVGSSADANNVDGNSLHQFQSPIFPLHSYVTSSSRPAIVATADASGFATNANANITVNVNVITNTNVNVNATANAHASPYGSHQQFSRKHRLENNRAAPSAPSAIGARPQYLTHLLSRQPFLRNFNDFVLAWEGCLVEETYPYRPFFNKAKVWKKSISPISLTEWPGTMKVAVYVPRKAVINTMRLYGGPIDYILFEVTEFGNLDLYGRLMTEKKYAKIVLPSHTLILFTTETKHCYLGSVFKGDTVIVEHL